MFVNIVLRQRNLKNYNKVKSKLKDYLVEVCGRFFVGEISKRILLSLVKFIEKNKQKAIIVCRANNYNWFEIIDICNNKKFTELNREYFSSKQRRGKNESGNGISEVST